MEEAKGVSTELDRKSVPLVGSNLVRERNLHGDTQGVIVRSGVIG